MVWTGMMLKYILDTFPIVKEHDEKAYGEIPNKARDSENI